MGIERQNYFDFAENDYKFFMDAYNNNYVYNGMASLAQNACEKYLKHIIEAYCNESIEQLSVLKSHQLNKLIDFIDSELPDFECNEDTIIKANGYYFASRYPGDQSFFVSEKDMKRCAEALDETRNAVKWYISKHQCVMDESFNKDFMIDSLPRRKGR